MIGSRYWPISISRAVDAVHWPRHRPTTLQSLPIPARRSHPRGAVYIAVLGVAMVVTLLGVTGLLAARLANASARQTANSCQAKACAEAGIDAALHEINASNSWRTDDTLADRLSDRVLGNGTFTVQITDEVDGNLNSNPYDPVTITSTGQKGGSSHAMQVVADARGLPMDILTRALHTGGELSISPSGEIIALGAPISTHGALNNQGFISGQVLCGSITNLGTVSGGATTGAATLTWPAAGVFSNYAAIATAINPGTSITGYLLTPGNNPWGSANPRGVYLISTGSDLTIKNSRIEGTLIINAPGRTVIIEEGVCMTPRMPHDPTLLVRGNLQLRSIRSQPLSEVLTLTNFNPSHSPYQGSSDIDILDTYPAEIKGLVFVRGTLSVINSPRVHGAVIVESNSASNAVQISGSLEIEYDYAIQETPAMDFTSAIEFLPRAGSWKRVVNP